MLPVEHDLLKGPEIAIGAGAEAPHLPRMCKSRLCRRCSFHRGRYYPYPQVAPRRDLATCFNVVAHNDISGDIERTGGVAASRCVASS